MIGLFDRVGHALQLRGRMIELARNLDFQFRVSRNRVIINRQATISRDELAILVRTSGLISSERASTLRAAANNLRIESPNCDACSVESPHDPAASFTCCIEWSAIHVTGDASR